MTTILEATTEEHLEAARRLFLAYAASIGFHPIPPYCHNPLPDPEFYQLDLTGHPPGEAKP